MAYTLSGEGHHTYITDQEDAVSWTTTINPSDTTSQTIMLASSLVALVPLLALTNAGPIAKRGVKQLIQAGTSDMCLSTQGGADAVIRGDIQNGTPVVLESCDTAAPWDISPGSGSIILSGTTFALDLGLAPSNNGAVYVSTKLLDYTTYTTLRSTGTLETSAEASGMDLVPYFQPPNMVSHRRPPYRTDWRHPMLGQRTERTANLPVYHGQQ
jgi:hypothetical protein